MGLEGIFEEIKGCKNCSLSETRTQVVFDGVPNDKPLFLVGEAPGGHEDVISGKPFSGQAGEQLTEFLTYVDIDRKNCYITNMVKCRPTKESSRPRYGKYANRKPTRKEMKACHPYFIEEMKDLDPKIIVTLGGVPLSMFTKEALGEVHGTPLSIDGRIVFPLYHPASVIYNRNLRDTYLSDLIKLKEYIKTNEYF